LAYPFLGIQQCKGGTAGLASSGVCDKLIVEVSVFGGKTEILRKMESIVIQR